jgi:hypothetical protein
LVCKKIFRRFKYYVARLDGVISAVANVRGGLGVSIAYYLVLVGLDELLGEATEVIAAEERKKAT